MATPRKKPEDLQKRGRKSRYSKDMCKLVTSLCMLGLTDEELAEFLTVSVATLNNWKLAHPEFLEALNAGRIIADAKVTKSLYRRAIGYRHKATKLFCYQGQVIAEDYTEVYPPDTGAASLWLSNRQRARWKQRQDVELTTPAGTLVVMSALTREPLPEPSQKAKVDE